MIDCTRILKMLDSVQAQIDNIKDEIEKIQAQSGDSEVEYDLDTGLPVEQEEKLYIPPIKIGEEVMGGVETDDFPDCCAVGNDQKYYCSGTLIAPNVIVTAEHCCDVTRVFLQGKSVFEPNEGETIRVIKQFAHPEVDLRVLILEHNSQVEPRHVAQGNEILDVKTALVAGFGTIDKDGTIGYGLKRCVEVPVMSLDGSAATDFKKYGCLPNREMVAGHRGLKRDTCRGDSGGPLYIKSLKGDYYLLGATSRGARGGLSACGDGGIYVRVDRCLDWIRQVTGVEVEGTLT